MTCIFKINKHACLSFEIKFLPSAGLFASVRLSNPDLQGTMKIMKKEKNDIRKRLRCKKAVGG